MGWEARKGIELPTASREPEGLARLAVSHFTTGYNDSTLRRRYRMPNLVHSQRGNMKAVPLPKRRSAEVPRRRMHLISARIGSMFNSIPVGRGSRSVDGAVAIQLAGPDLARSNKWPVDPSL